MKLSPSRTLRLGAAAVAGLRATAKEATAAVAPAGWYGKLPSLGDFASRRMPPGFLEVWDAWLAAGMADWSARDPGGWLDVYLAAPSRRFLMMPASAHRRGAAAAFAVGVLMPSVDRVGRYFPLTLLQPLPRLPVDIAEAGALLIWLQRADDLAVDALQENWSIELLETALDGLARQAPPWFAAPAKKAGPMPFAGEWLRAAGADAAAGAPACAGLPALRAAVASAALAERLRGQVWWLGVDPSGAEHLRISHGLPSGPAFIDLLGRPLGGPASTPNPSGEMP